MRLVFVNRTHPGEPHVSGMRIGRFAREMSQRGHEVAVLTSTLSTEPAGTGGASLAERLATHDWTSPLVVPAESGRAHPRDGSGGLPGPIRRGVTMWRLAVQGGAFVEWQREAWKPSELLARQFRPDCVWATFGNTSNWIVAQRLAARAGCPWVADIKDNWELFIPPPLRRWMAWRFRDAAGHTCNSEHHQIAARASIAFRHVQVIYSGVADEFFEHPAPTKPARHRLLLVGSTYRHPWLERYLAALRAWLARLDDVDRRSIEFLYAGSDGERVARALGDIPLGCATRVEAQLPIHQLAELTRDAFANSYIWLAETFHHKLMELLIAGRPVIAYPGENSESRRLAAGTPTQFAACADERDLAAALDAAWERRGNPAAASTGVHWRWSDFAAELEAFLARAARR